MILLVDAGNSRVKWRLVRGGQELRAGQCATDAADCLQDAWRALAPLAAVVSCVAGEVVGAAIAWQTGLPGARIHEVVAEPDRHGLRNRYAPPERLGADRYAALVGACRLGLGDCVVAGVGTALTADMLTREGEFLGGCIGPGPAMMRAALMDGTALLGERLVEAGAGVFEDYPRDTAAGMRAGVTLALAGVIEGMRARLERQVGRPARIVLTGGARDWARPGLTGACLDMDNLVLEGLAWIARDLGYDA